MAPYQTGALLRQRVAMDSTSGRHRSDTASGDATPPLDLEAGQGLDRRLVATAACLPDPIGETGNDDRKDRRQHQDRGQGVERRWGSEPGSGVEPDRNGYRGGSARQELADHKVVDGEGEHDGKAGQDGGREQGEQDTPHRLERG